MEEIEEVREREREKNLQVLAVAVPRVRENPKMQA